jgi:pimeloyl-ACP methyl ester carboxylesterase
MATTDGAHETHLPDESGPPPPPYAPADYRPSAPSRWVDLAGPTHYVDHGGPDGAPQLVLVHGLGGSHANWAALAPLLTDRYRVLALDLAGFGLTRPGPDRTSTVFANRRLLDRFLREVTGPAVLVGNSMGGMITALETARSPELVRAAVLIDPALPLVLSRPDPLLVSAIGAFAVPAPVLRVLTRRRPPPTPEDIANRILRLCTADPSRIPDDVLRQHLALARARADDPGADADFLTAARSLGAVLARRRRYAETLRSIRAPVLLLHGDRDRLVPIRGARLAAARNPSWQLEVATGVGHVPMLEAAAWTAHQLHTWLPTALSQGQGQGQGD